MAFSLRHPRTVIGLACILVVVALPGVLQLELRTDGRALVPADAPAVRRDRELRRAFDLEDPVAIVLRAPTGRDVFDVETLSLLVDITNRVKRLPCVDPDEVVSLATETTDRVVPGTLRHRGFLEQVLTEPVAGHSATMTRLRSDLERFGVYTGTLIANDARALAVWIGVESEETAIDASLATDRVALHRSLQATIDALGCGDRVSVVGAPIAESLLGHHILRDLGVPDRVLAGGFGDDDHPPLGVGLVPLALLVMATIFWLRFRRVTAVVLPLAEVGAAIVFTFGVMGWLGVPVYLTTAVLPIVLTATGVADELHVLDRFRRRLDLLTPESRAASVGAVFAELRSPITKTSLTTAIAFSSFLLSPLQPVRMFGLFAAIGVLFCWGWSLVVVPAILVSVRRDWLRRPVACGRDGRTLFRGGRGLRLLRPWLRRPAFAIAVIVAVGCALGPGLRAVAVQDSWVDGFAADSEFRRATEEIDDRFHGTHLLRIVADTGEPWNEGEVDADAVGVSWLRVPSNASTADAERWVGGWVRVPAVEPTSPNSTVHAAAMGRIVRVERTGEGVVLHTERRGDSLRGFRSVGSSTRVPYHVGPAALLDPDVLGALHEFGDFLRTCDSVGGVVGLTDHLAATHYAVGGGRTKQHRIARRSSAVLSDWRTLAKVQGAERQREIVDERYRRGVITAFLAGANYRATDRLLTAIREYETNHLAPLGIALEFGGDIAVSQATIASIVDTQRRSLALSLIAIFLVTAVLGRSLWWGLFCVLPGSFAVFVSFAAMGWLGVPLGVATSMFAAMTLGIGVDYAIHLSDRYRRRIDGGVRRRVLEAVRVVGPAIVVDAAAIAGGFGLLAVSNVPANARLGLLVAASVLTAAIVTLVLLPAVLLVVGRLPRHAAVSTSEIAVAS